VPGPGRLPGKPQAGPVCTVRRRRRDVPDRRLLQCFLSIGISIAAIEFWPTIIDQTVAQIDLLGGLAGGAGALTGPFETAAAAAALATRAIEHGAASVGYRRVGNLIEEVPCPARST
jgi:hypothetical protein